MANLLSSSSCVRASIAKGIACMLASSLGFACMAACVRLCDDCGEQVSSFQKSFFRNAVAFTVALTVFLRGSRKISSDVHVRPALSRKAILLLMARSVAGTLGIFGHFYSLSHIPVGEALALNKTAPFFTVAFSWLFLGEKARTRTLFCLITAFAGVLLVIKPGFRPDGMFAAICGLAGGFGAGVAYTCVRELGLLRVDGSIIVLVFSAFSCLASVPFTLSGGIDPMTPSQLAAMLAAGVFATIGQFGITAAYAFAPSRDIAVFDYAGIVFASVLGFALFGQIPDMLSVGGFVLIVLAFLLGRN